MIPWIMTCLVMAVFETVVAAGYYDLMCTAVSWVSYCTVDTAF